MVLTFWKYVKYFLIFSGLEQLWGRAEGMRIRAIKFLPSFFLSPHSSGWRVHRPLPEEGLDSETPCSQWTGIFPCHALRGGHVYSWALALPGLAPAFIAETLPAPSYPATNIWVAGRNLAYLNYSKVDGERAKYKWWSLFSKFSHKP